MNSDTYGRIFWIVVSIGGIFASSRIFRYDEERLRKEYESKGKFFTSFVSYEKYKKINEHNLVLFSVMLIIALFLW
jgi:hypothetical protein